VLSRYTQQSQEMVDAISEKFMWASLRHTGVVSRRSRRIMHVSFIFMSFSMIEWRSDAVGVHETSR
jgi:hypothetical protein